MSELAWFITGASSGLGRHLTSAALAEGHRVAATARDPSRLADLMSEAPPGSLVAPQLDVTDPRQTKAAVDATLEAFGRIDVVCINAGFGMVGTIEEVEDELVRSVFETNVFAPLTLLRTVLPHMRERGQGRILLISSISGLAANPGSGIYSASKFALEGIGEALAAEVAPFGIKVTLVEPGGLRTGFAGPALGEAPVIEAYASTPAGQWRHKLRGNHGRQPGDPALAAKVILDVVALPEPPLRLVLGEGAMARARNKIASVSRELESFASLGRSIDRPPLQGS